MTQASASSVRRVLARRTPDAVRLLAELVGAPSPLGASGLEAQQVVARYLQASGYTVSCTSGYAWTARGTRGVPPRRRGARIR